jgi:hypothetical protein
MKDISTFHSLLALGAVASLPVLLYPESQLEERPVAVSGNHKIAARETKLVGELIPCYNCDNDTCNVVKMIKVDTPFKFDCLCPNGQKKDGTK